MTDNSDALSDSNVELKTKVSLETSSFGSCAVLKASAIAPRDIIDPLPEELLRWMHDGLERGTEPRCEVNHGSSLDFEAIIVDRLFPLRDPRPFVRRLRAHCQATAVAAELIAEFQEQSPGVASVAGWLHDIGLAACLRHADEVSYVADEETLGRFWPNIVRSSAQHGIRLASSWRLPSAIRHAIRARESFPTLGMPNPLVAALIVAEHVAFLIGYGFHDPIAETVIQTAMSVTSLPEKEFDRVASRAEQAMRQSRFSGPTSALSRGA